MDTDDRAFLKYWKSPGSDTLIELLRDRQRVIYLICLRVLRHPHDAEDAAQEVLVEVVRGAPRLREPLAFRRWLTRVALNTALEHLRRRARRVRREERSVAMKSPAPPDPVADSLHEALARLEDEDRCLLMEKYFEGVTLERLAAREGLSISGMGKRLERARDELKRKLALAGLGTLAPNVERLLDASPAIESVPDLVSSSAAVQSAAALAGGAVMASKLTLSLTTVAIVLVVGTLIGAGGGYWIGFNRAVRVHSPVQVGGNDRRPGSTVSANPVSASPKVDSDVPALGSESPKPPEKNALIARLDQFQEWMDRYDVDNPPQTTEDYEARFLEIKVQLKGVREMILKDPEPFLEWLEDPKHGKHLVALFDATLTLKQSMYGLRIQEYSSLPPSLMSGLLRLLQNGPYPVKEAIFSFAVYVSNPPAEYRSHFVSLLSDPNQFIQSKAAQILLTQVDPSSQELEGVTRVIEKMRDDGHRWMLMQALGRLPKAETREWILQALESGRLGDFKGRMVSVSLQWWLEPGRVSDPAFHARAARILETAMQKSADEDAYLMNVYTALSLPASMSLPLLQQAATGAPSERLRKAAVIVLEKSRSEGANSRTLQEAWMGAQRN